MKSSGGWVGRIGLEGLTQEDLVKFLTDLPEISLLSISGSPSFKTTRLSGRTKNYVIVKLVNSRILHNFLGSSIVIKNQLVVDRDEKIQ